jgi:HAAS domain-containing protein
MTTIALTPEGEAFLARVRDELADLPPDERDELLEDIESHLAEVAGEGDVALAARLGSAEEFAHELRHSAGLPPRGPEVSPSRFEGARARLTAVARRGASLRGQLDATLLWWLARGWLLAVAVAIAIGQLGNTRAWSLSHTWLPHAGLRGQGALVALAAFVALSFWLARRAAAGRGVRLDRAASALALVAVVPALWHLDSPPRDHYYSYRTIVQTQQEPGLAFNGVPVANIFPFDRSGRPLNDVLLYLPGGLPLDVASQVTDPNRRYLVTRRGERLYNSFPVRYFDPGTTRVTRPHAGPSVQIPNVLTPPLGSRTP